jgi:NitT/TauT family transport system substrate-binding protein
MPRARCRPRPCSSEGRPLKRGARTHGLTLVAALALVLGACAAPPSPTASRPDRVRLQLKWVPQAQFAGYYAAQALGFYAAEGLDVTIRPGGPDAAAEDLVADGQADIGVGWLSALLVARDRGRPLVNIAQVFGASGIRQVAFASSGIRGPADLRGRRIAVWFSGNEYPLLATLEKYGIDRTRDVTLVPQPFDMRLLLDRAVDAAAAMTYNEYRQLLEAGVRAEDLVVIDFNREGTAMLEDGLFTTEEWLRRPGHRGIAARFLRASLQGWATCRTRPSDCVDAVLAQSPALGRAHQTGMMAEINKLIWDAGTPAGEIGRMNDQAFWRTAAIALRFGVIKRPASGEAFTHEVWDLAHRR